MQMSFHRATRTKITMGSPDQHIGINANTSGIATHERHCSQVESFIIGLSLIAPKLYTFK